MTSRFGKTPAPDDRSAPQLVARALADANSLVKDEIALAKKEIQQSIDSAKIGAGMFGVAGVMAVYGGVALVVAGIAGLAVVIDTWLAALIIAVALFAIAGVAAVLGKKKVDDATPPLERSQENVKRDIDTVKEAH
ncbi:phage holin family protein [Demequina flava]|uniref:phage holin family protein n=1 Tax=Demequina flava TaxID=1095025 RepID=UPI000782D1EC|nr:phage holin family protein [Demequina flava]